MDGQGVIDTHLCLTLVGGICNLTSVHLVKGDGQLIASLLRNGGNLKVDVLFPAVDAGESGGKFHVPALLKACHFNGKVNRLDTVHSIVHHFKGASSRLTCADVLITDDTHGGIISLDGVTFKQHLDSQVARQSAHRAPCRAVDLIGMDMAGIGGCRLRHDNGTPCRGGLLHGERIAHIDSFACYSIRCIEEHLRKTCGRGKLLRQDVRIGHLAGLDSWQDFRQPGGRSTLQSVGRSKGNAHALDADSNQCGVIDEQCHIVCLFILSACTKVTGTVAKAIDDTTGCRALHQKGEGYGYNTEKSFHVW